MCKTGMQIVYLIKQAQQLVWVQVMAATYMGLGNLADTIKKKKISKPKHMCKDMLCICCSKEVKLEVTSDNTELVHKTEKCQKYLCKVPMQCALLLKFIFCKSCINYNCLRVVLKCQHSNKIELKASV